MIPFWKDRGQKGLNAGSGLAGGLIQKAFVQSLFLHRLLLVGLEGREILDGEGVEDGGFFVKDLHGVLKNLVGEDRSGGEGNGDGLPREGNFCPGQVHPRLDLSVIGEDEFLGGEGNGDAVEIIAVFKLGHVGVVVADGGQLADLV